MAQDLNLNQRLIVTDTDGVRVTGITSGTYLEISGNLPGYTNGQYPVLKSGGTIHFGVNGVYRAYLEGNDTYFGILNNSSVTTVLLKTSGSSYLNGGNVGIGTTSPATELEVKSQIGIRSSRPTSTQWVNLYYAGIESSPTNDLYITSGLGYGTIFSTNGGGEKMRITSGGNVGIGTTSPSGKLHIQTDASSSFTFTGASTSGYATTFHMDNTGLDIGHNSASRSLNLKTGSTDRLTITGGGNVGIGTTSPADKLQVQGNLAVPAGVIYNGAAANSAGLRLSGAYFDASGYYGIRFFSSTATVGSQTERMRITNTGNVGIGTASPSYKLDVVGDANISGKLISGNGLSSSYGVYTDGGTYTNQWQKVFSISYPNVYAYQTLKLLVNIAGDTSNVNTNAEVHINYKFQANNGRIFANIINYGENPLTASDFEILRDNTNAVINVYIRVNRNYSRPHYTILNGSGYVSWRNTIVGTSLSGETNDGFTEKNIVEGFTSRADSGNLGIGTTSPSYKLHLDNNATGYIARFQGDTNNISFYDGGTAGIGIGSNVSQDLKLYVNDSLNTGIVIKSSGNVGIGTISPNITNQAGSGTLTVKNSSTYGVLEIAGSSSVQGGVLSFFGDTTRFAQLTGEYTSANNGMMIFRTLVGGTITENIRITGGNVGIGTTSPSYKLDVYGSARIGGSNGDVDLVIEADADNSGENDNPRLILKQDGGLVNAIIGLNGDADNAFTGALTNGMYISAYDALQLRGGSGGIVTIDGNGNVGIGTTIPGDKLVVAGSLRVGNNGYDSTPGGTAFSHTIAANSGTSRVVNFDGNGYNPSVWWNNGNTRLGAIDGEAEGLAFWANSSDGTWFKNFYITPSLTIFHRSVGIGTTNPYSLLQVGDPEQTTPAELTIASRYDGGGPILNFRTDHPNNANQWNMARIVATDDGNYNGRLEFRTTVNNGQNGTQPQTRMVIKATGNVGIGTTSPSAKLHVVGSEWDNTGGGGVIFENSNTVGASLTLKPSSSAVTYGRSGWAVYAGGPGAAIGDGNLGFWAHETNQARMVIQRGGNVGIGVTSPGAKLEIAGSSGNIKLGDASGYNGISLNGTLDIANYNILSRSSDKSLYINRPSGKNIYFREQNSDQVIIASGGNVGIGTTSPSEALHIYRNAASAEIRLQNNTISSYIRSNTDNLNFYVSNGEKLRITSGGNVGIGTSSPSYKLDVSGGAIAIRGNAAGNSLRFDDTTATSRNALYVDTSNYLNIGNANYAGVKFVQTASAPSSGAFDGQSVQQAIGTTDEGIVLAAPDAWLAVRVGTTDYAIPMYTTG